MVRVGLTERDFGEVIGLAMLIPGGGAFQAERTASLEALAWKPPGMFKKRKEAHVTGTQREQSSIVIT